MIFDYGSERAASRGDKGGDPRCVFYAGRRFDAAGRVDTKRLDVCDRLGDVIRAQAAGQDKRNVDGKFMIASGNIPIGC